MSSTSSGSRPEGPKTPVVRSLPAAPSLEYERKEAKALLDEIRRRDREALRRVARVHPAALGARPPEELQLADAQHVIAREYGFMSWPRLVKYYEELERHRRAPRHNTSDMPPESLEGAVRHVIRRHERREPLVARELAHFVPRFYGRSTSEILSTPITEDEARLVVAREHRRAKWEELVERANATRSWHERRVWEDDRAPLARARTAIRAHDVDALATILDEYPELLTPAALDREWRTTLASIAISFEYDAKTEEARRITELLARRGADIQRELDERLLGFPQDGDGRAQRVRWYLARGANPNWMPPNGFTVLEHAIARYRDAMSVDLIAEHVTPRRALWIAAGLGDVVAVRSFIAGHAKLTAEGRLNRPDLMAMAALGGLPPNHDADDLEIMWEAFQVAGWNGRWAAMDALLEAGLPVDYSPAGWPLIMEAVGNMLVPLVEHVVRRGADLDREWPGHGSARAYARERVMNLHEPRCERARQLLAICGAGTPEEVLADLDAKRPSPPPLERRTLRALQLAADDAARQEQSSVRTDNLLVGVLRLSRSAFLDVVRSAGTDMTKLQTMLRSRTLPGTDPLLGAALPRDAAAEKAVQTAIAEADTRRRDVVMPLHLLLGILRQRTAPGAVMLRDAGASDVRLTELLEGSV